jgi:hypothetical protein
VLILKGTACPQCGGVYCVIGAGARGRGERVRARTHAIAMVDLHGKSLECRAGVCRARLWWATAAS